MQKTKTKLKIKNQKSQKKKNTKTIQTKKIQNPSFFFFFSVLFGDIFWCPDLNTVIGLLPSLQCGKLKLYLLLHIPTPAIRNIITLKTIPPGFVDPEAQRQGIARQFVHYISESWTTQVFKQVLCSMSQCRSQKPDFQ